MSKSADSSTKRYSLHGKAIKKIFKLQRDDWVEIHELVYIVSLCIFFAVFNQFQTQKEKKKKLSADYSNVLRKRAVHKALYKRADSPGGCWVKRVKKEHWLRLVVVCYTV